MRRVRLAILFAVLLLLQGTAAGRLTFFNTAPNLILTATAAFSFLNDDYDSLIMGAAAGLLQDICYGPLVGGSPFLYISLGMIMREVRTRVYRENKLVQLGVTAFSTVFFAAGSWIAVRVFTVSGISPAEVLRTLPAAVIYNYIVFLLIAHFTDRKEDFMFH